MALSPSGLPRMDGSDAGSNGAKTRFQMAEPATFSCVYLFKNCNRPQAYKIEQMNMLVGLNCASLYLGVWYEEDRAGSPPLIVVK